MAIRSWLTAIDRFFVRMARLFGSEAISTRQRYLRLFALFGIIDVVTLLAIPGVSLGFAIFGVLAVFAVQRAWKANEDLRDQIFRQKADGNADQLPDLRWFALITASQLFILFPLLFRLIHERFGNFSVPPEAGFFHWFAFSFDRFCKSLLDWSEIYGIHFTEIKADATPSRHLLLMKSLIIDLIIIQGFLRLWQIYTTQQDAVEMIPRAPEAAVRLGRRIVPRLLKCARSGDLPTRLGAITALGAFPNMNVEPVLRSLLTDAQQPVEVRARAAISLGELRDPSAISLILDRLNDSSPAMRIGIITALGRYQHRPAFDDLMQRSFTDPDASVRAAAVQAMLAIAEDESSRQFLLGLEGLQSPDAKIRGAAALSLGERNDPRAVMILEHFFDDRAEGNDWSLPIGQIAIQALREMAKRGTTPAVDALVRALQHHDQTIREWASEEIAQLIDVRLLPRLAPALRDPSPTVRDNLYPLFGAVDHPDAIPYLLSALEWEIGQPKPQLVEVLDALLNYDDPRILALVRQVAETKSADMAEAFRRVRGEGAVEFMLGGLRHPAAAVREAAAEGLGEIAEPLAVEPLIALLADSNENVRFIAALSLGRISDGRAVPTLLQRLQDGDFVRETAIESLGLLGDRSAIPSLRHTFQHDGTATGRANAAVALGRLGDLDSLHMLIAEQKNEDNDIRAGCAEALGRLRDVRAIETVIAMSNDSDAKVRSSAVVALRRIGSVECLPALVQRLGDSGKPRQAKESVGRIAGNMLLELAQEGRPCVHLIIQRMVDAPELDSTLRTFLTNRLPREILVPELIEVLRQASAPVQMQALKLMIAVADDRYIPVLRDMLPHASAELIPQIVRALTATGEPNTLADIRPFFHDPATQVIVLESARTLLDRGANDLAEAGLAQSDPVVRRTAAQTLLHLLDPQSTTRFRALLDDADTAIVQSAIEALGLLRDQESIPAIRRKLATSEYREKAILALGRMGDRESISAIRSLLREGDASLRGSACLTLGWLEDHDSIPEMLAIVDDLNAPGFDGACQALWEMQVTDAVPILARHIQEKLANANVPIALAMIGDPRSIEPLRALAQYGEQLGATALNELGRLGGDGVLDFLAHMSRSKKAALRAGAAYGLGRLGDPRGIEPLRRLLSDDAIPWDNAVVAGCAYHGLGMIGDPIASRDLLAGLSHASPIVRYWAGWSIRHTADASIIPELRHALRRDDREYGYQSLHNITTALARLQAHEAIPELRHALRVGSPTLRHAAIIGLGRLNDAESQSTFQELLKSGNTWDRDAAAIALGTFDKSPEASLMPNGWLWWRWWAVQKLTAPLTLEQILLLSRQIADDCSEIETTGVRLLQRTDHPQAKRALRGLRRSPFRRIREAAASTIGE